MSRVYTLCCSSCYESDVIVKLAVQPMTTRGQTMLVGMTAKLHEFMGVQLVDFSKNTKYFILTIVTEAAVYSDGKHRTHNLAL